MKGLTHGLHSRLVEFGREQFVVYLHESALDSFLSLPSALKPLRRNSSSGDTSFEVLPSLPSEHAALGNRNLLMNVSKGQKQDFVVAKLINLDAKREVTLFDKEQKVSGLLARFSRLPEDHRTGAHLGAISFAPDDSAIGVAVREDGESGTVFRVTTYRPDWQSEGEKVHRKTFTISGAKDDRIVLATAAGGALDAYWMDSNHKVFIQPLHTSGGTTSPLSLFGIPNLADFDFVGEEGKLLGVTNDGTVLMWNSDVHSSEAALKRLNLEDLRTMACSVASRSLTQDEVALFVGSDYALRDCTVSSAGIKNR